MECRIADGKPLTYSSNRRDHVPCRNSGEALRMQTCVDAAGIADAGWSDHEIFTLMSGQTHRVSAHHSVDNYSRHARPVPGEKTGTDFASKMEERSVEVLLFCVSKLASRGE
jgi:hypothetical protein